MVTAALASGRIDVDPRGGKDPLPAPLASGVGILPRQRPWQLDPARPVRQIAVVLTSDEHEMCGEISGNDRRQGRRAVLVALARPNDDRFRAKSTSLTRRRAASRRRWPAPYNRMAISRVVPRKLRMTLRTSSRVSTT